MKRVLLFHWNAKEAEERAGRLRGMGFEAAVFLEQNAAGLPAALADPPEAFVIDLSRMPSHGRAIGSFLRRRKTTRAVPLVIVGGEAAKVARVRALLPDATYTEWNALREALRVALRSTSAALVVPKDAMADYSGTPLPKKLGLRAGSVVALLGAPGDFAAKLQPLQGVRLQTRPAGADRLLLFAHSHAELTRRFPAAKNALPQQGALWICWPKKAAGLTSDLTQTLVRAFGLERGLVDYKICAIDDTWSGLCFSRRKRPLRS